ncbi:MAG: urea ABC transporter permease subunit UrtC, partial [Pseudomonadales bacterium]
MPTWRTGMFASRGGNIFIAILVAVTLGASIGNQLIPEGSWLHVDTYTITLLGKYLSFALLAMAVDVIWGYCGILSLGHGAFFALGGYAMGMYLMRQIG